MRTNNKILWILLIGLLAVSCNKLDNLNVSPNQPSSVSTATLFTGSQKKMMDYIYDVWFSGRQALPYAQYWSQRTYTEEDRYQIRESTNNSYFNQLYVVAGNLKLVEDLNTNPTTSAAASVYGNNKNQIAAAKIMKVWLMQVIADTWGSVPYTEAFKLNSGVNYPKYDDLNTLYPLFIKQLDSAVALINVNEAVFTSGDVVYDGDPIKWKKFANSLKCRLAIRLSKVDPAWKTYIASAITSGVFQSNSDEAMFKYLSEAPNECYFYRGYFVDNRNDFSITRPFVDLLKGQRDTLNNKSHPWEGVVDPRLAIYTTPRGGKYIGLPYGLPSSEMTSGIRGLAPSWLAAPPVMLNKDFSVPLMTYSELCFIISEYNGFSKDWYEKGVDASMKHWASLSGTTIDQHEIDSYIASVNSVVNQETVAVQKYIHLYMQGVEAWSEYRRTGYPNTLIKPGEYTYAKSVSNILKFTPISETKGDIAARVKYPTNESTLNPKGFNDAVAKLQDGTNNYYSKMYWDVRTTSNPHPANK